ncbi:hypothetical protein LINPERHAP1_LOCUS34357 [Linum perenne]
MYQDRGSIIMTSLLVLYLLVLLLDLLERYCLPRVRDVSGRRLREKWLRGRRSRNDFMVDATTYSDRSSLDTIRVDMHVFKRLCKVLVAEGGLRKTNKVPIEEMIVMFLWTMGHNIKNRILQKRFRQLGKTICAVIHAVLTSIPNMRHTLYRKPFPVPDHCQHPNWKHFKALDGTHIKVRAKIQDQPRYRNRKGEVSINVLGVCNPDCQFMYCLAGWEGSAHDAQVLQDALCRPNGLTVPKAMGRKRKDDDNGEAG